MHVDRQPAVGCDPATSLLAEHLGDRALVYLVKIYATDIDEEALGASRHAVYRLDQLKDVPDRFLERYFTKDGQLWRVRREIRPGSIDINKLVRRH